MSQVLKRPVQSKPINIPKKDDKKFEVFRKKLLENQKIKYKDLLFAAGDEVSSLFLSSDSNPKKEVETFVNIELYNHNNPYERRKDFHGPFAGPNPDDDKNKGFKGPFPGPT
jgi:hypothetical protein